eukprot:6249546-Alexandrium_andersonii.AAC.1
MLARAAICLNPQSALRKTQHRFRRSNLELRGPGNGLKIGPPKLPRCEFCTVVRADSESANEGKD